DACGVTDRTMRTVFVDSVGLTPKQYLQYRTLNLVHRALRAADPEETSVSTVLLDHGEWDFGRFARRYRQAFGELPSQTLRRS
ncbi:MAG: helix-turn-helix domain-containing protein, partial [Maioricimonas sp. JB045]